jgi:hypothetical protein
VCEICGWDYERISKRTTASQKAAMLALKDINKVVGEVVR